MTELLVDGEATGSVGVRNGYDTHDRSLLALKLDGILDPWTSRLVRRRMLSVSDRRLF
jgi:hypothetical protein